MRAVNITGNTVLSQVISKSQRFSPNRVFPNMKSLNKAVSSKSDRYKQIYKNNLVQTSGDNILTVDELKEEMEKEFSKYTMTEKKERVVKDGKFACYIDKDNLKKMASDPEYRAKVYSILQREYDLAKGYSYKNGANTVTGKMTGVNISICSDNKSSNGIPISIEGKHKDSFKIDGLTVSATYSNTQSANDSFKNIKKIEAALNEAKEKHLNKINKTTTQNTALYSNQEYNSIDFTV